MMEFIKMLSARNPILYYSGLVSLMAAVVCLLISMLDHKQVMGVNAWIKPIKFFLSIWIFNWTMALYLSLLPAERATAIRWYSMMAVIVFLIEVVIITGQAARGQLSHFNISSPLNGILFSLMGVAIITLTIWTAVAASWFWQTDTPPHYPAGFWWGIRFGILLCVVFSFEGMVMASRLQHTVGASDGSEGLPLLNWSKQHGDLRVAHFVGLHALQVLPLLGFFVFKKPGAIMAVSILYAGFSVWLFLRAMAGKGINLFA